MFKNMVKYYIIGSSCTGWDPNEAMHGSADSILGKWRELYNPCFSLKADNTFLSQSTFVLPVDGKSDQYVFMACRWENTTLKTPGIIGFQCM